ncbi:MAG: nucleotidyl transferase AbiEii/AbiGii toxin family protein [Ferruginibacter sp.]
MQLPALSNFDLVGGTALSLKYGHRKSIDLDLFTTAPFENETVFNKKMM